ncbi:MAG: DUF4178 domain-containing protein [Desulfotignum sp.]|nr:DUF4178 domain-containing protein [Desulfotignum sp.]MCF8087478.1 DUF4178 domain-containing protein [Desulfotignum sp.]MCF8138993.1 DUF4178 domain-containing protein [Desulfotignum sp.]
MLDTATRKSFQERFHAIRTLGREDLVPKQESSRLSIRDAGPGAFFTYLGQTWWVREINSYQETSDDFNTLEDYEIHELTCLCLETGETIHFEWEYDDVLEVSMTKERLSFRNLKDDAGQSIDEDDLDQIADDKDGVVVNDQTFWYEDDWAALFNRGGRQEKVYMYEFENEAGSLFLTIEEWQGSGREEYRIYTSVPINPDSITLISKGGQ